MKMGSCKLLLVIWCYVKIVHGSTSSPIVYLPTDINHPEQEQFNVSRAGRVLGGTDATATEFPYHVALHLHFGTGGSFIGCGGALISLTHILTCHHCIPNELRTIDAHLGAQQWSGPNHEVHRVSWYALHDHENNNPFVDLAVLGLGQPVTVKQHLAPIALPRLSQVGDFFIDRVGFKTGYGGVPDGKLKQIPIKFVPSDHCGNSIGMLCSYGRDNSEQATTGGDSGGPTVLLESGIHVLVGIHSFHYGSGMGATRLALFLPWIREKTGIPMD